MGTILPGTTLLVGGRQCSVVKIEGMNYIVNFEDNSLVNESICLKNLEWELMTARKRKKKTVSGNSVTKGMVSEKKDQRKKQKTKIGPVAEIII